MKKTAYRRSQILKELDEKGQVNVNELSETLGVSEVTIRNDLDKLEKNNLLVRAHGGAFKTNNIALTIVEKREINLAEKRRIGKKAASLIDADDTIIIDSGTTTFEITNHLDENKNLTIISNALDIVNNLVKLKNIELIMPGGFLKDFSMSMVGPLADRSLRQLYCKKLFLGIDGMRRGVGMFTHYLEEAHLNQIMIDVADEVIVVADSSKFDKSGMAFICNFDKIDKLITDDKVNKEDVKYLEQNNIEVIIA